HLIIRICVLSAIIISILVFVIGFVYKNSFIYSMNAKYYIYGRASFVSTSTNTIRMSSIRTNFITGGKGDFDVRVTSRTQIIDENKDKQKVKLSDISSGNQIQVFCKESELKSNEKATAVRIVIKKLELE
ncbi:MAG: hypothetical protein RSF67_07465, partial [Clostridia bacterium]